MPGFENQWFVQAKLLQEKADDFVAKGLRLGGWKYTCQTPGSVWLWEKEVDGRVLLLNEATAAKFQERWDREKYFKEYPNEMND